MPVLPLIDLMLLSGWTALFAGFVLKAVALTTTYRPAIFGMSSTDFFMIAMAALLFAIALAARTWVKSQEPRVTASRRRQETLDAWKAILVTHGFTAELVAGLKASKAWTQDPEFLGVLANDMNTSGAIARLHVLAKAKTAALGVVPQLR